MPLKKTKTAPKQIDQSALVEACRDIQYQAKHGSKETLHRSISALDTLLGKVD